MIPESPDYEKLSEKIEDYFHVEIGEKEIVSGKKLSCWMEG